MLPTCTAAKLIIMFGTQALKIGFKPDFSTKHILQITSNFIIAYKQWEWESNETIEAIGDWRQ